MKIFSSVWSGNLLVSGAPADVNSPGNLPYFEKFDGNRAKTTIFVLFMIVTAISAASEMVDWISPADVA